MGLIYLDACLLIYAVEQHPEHASTVRAAVAAAPPQDLAISDLVRMECLVKPLRTGDIELQLRYEAAFAQFAWLTLPAAVFDHAATLRARFALRTPDALHLACAQHHRCESLWTNDERLLQAAHGLARNIIRTPQGN
ncbi:MAG: type II toxin-antitoxin system VapC family toxin [Gammaproteobacteria bacterium]|nr:type II toxin-antitoxin system VapC family toxin [Gammaproteobacteria bacterium]